MAEMSMNKAIHGAFRRDLDRFIDALQRFPVGDSTRAAQLWRAWQNFDDQLTRHHTGEHDIAWPALQQVGVSSDLLAEMDAEHEGLAAALARAGGAMAQLRQTASAEAAQTALTAMRELQQVAGAHMEHEEAQLEPIYAAKHDDPTIKAMGREFAKVGPRTGGIFFAWVTNGASHEENAAITANVPKPVLAVLSGVFGRPYRRDVASVWTS